MRVGIEELRSNIFKALIGLNHDEEDAHIITDVIMFAELRANNQGVIKLIAGALNPHPNQSPISIPHESPVSARIDGGQRIGMVVVAKAVEIAIQKASSTGMSIVGCSGYSSATGALGVWARKITDAGLIGIVMSQCSEMVAPHGSYEPIFGTNPIAIGVPTLPRAQILDMATSACAFYGIKMAEKAGESIPDDIAYNEKGEPTTNPTEALKGAIRVFDRGHKGSHLALMVELLAGAFTGASMENKLQSENWGSLVIAIDPNVMGDRAGFLASATQMCERVKNAKKLPGTKDIFLPGERGDELEQENAASGTLEFSEDIFNSLTAMVAQQA